MRQIFTVLILIYFSSQVTPKSVDTDVDHQTCDNLEKKTYEIETNIAELKTQMCGLEGKFKEQKDKYESQLGKMAANMTAVTNVIEDHTNLLTTLREDIDNLVERLDKTSSTPAPTDHYVCPANWLKYNATCIYFGREKITWTEAKFHCQMYGAHLLVVDSEELNTFLKIRLRAVDGNNHYVGGIDFGRHNWIWDYTNREFDYTDWRSSQPSGGRSEHCMVICSGSSCQWNDVDCYSQYKYICQKDVVLG